MAAMRIVICGYYGFSNAGDDAILEASVDLIRTSHPEVSISVITYPNADLDSVYRATGLPAIDGTDIAHIDQLIAKADLVLIGGGGLVQDHLPSDHNQIGRSSHGNLTFWMTLAVMAHGHGVPVSTWMIGVGPLTTDQGRHDARMLLSLMRTVSVRDEESAELTRSLGVSPERIAVGADPVFDVTRRRPRREQSPRSLGVVIRNWDGISSWLTPIASALDRVIDTHDVNVRLIPFQTGRGGIESDDLVALRLASRIEASSSVEIVGSAKAPLELFDILSDCSAVLGMRLHSLIFAAAAGVPTVGIAYDPKVTQTMKRIGREAHVTDLSSPDEEWLYHQLVDALDESAGSDLESIRSALASAADEVLKSGAATPAVPTELVPALVASLSAAASETRFTKAQLQKTQQLLDERNAYLTDRVSELHAVRSEFQAFRDARAVKLAQLAWDGRRVAMDTINSVRRRGSAEHVDSRGGLTLTEVLSDNSASNGFVVFAPSIDWDVELFQRPQQMATAFARRGYTVLYQVDEQYRNGLLGYRKVSDGIFEGYLADDELAELGQIRSPLFMSYVYNFEWGRNLADATTVYEHIDDLEVFEHVYPRRDLDRWHDEALTSADVVVGSAVDLMADLTTRRPDALLVPNGVDVDHFAARDHDVPADLEELVDAGVPIVGYYGALAEWFDYELLAELAERLPHYAFVLIGPDYDGTLPRSKITAMANVHWLGPKPYGTLPAYLVRFSVATIPFVVNDVTHAVSPLKLFEYMAGGKPVVTPPLRECARHSEVLLAHGVDEWVEMLELAIELSEDPGFQQRMIAGARDNTWEARVATILDAIG